MSRPGTGRRIDIRREMIYGRGFTPADIPGGWAWLRGRTDTITSTPTKVSAWADSFGNGNHATQAVDAQQPIYTAANANFNGKASIRCSGAQCLDFVNTIGNWDNVTVCLVTRPVSVTGNQLIMESNAAAGARDFQLYQSGAADGPNIICNGAAGSDHLKFAASDTTLTKYRRAYRMPWSALTTTEPSIYTDGALSTLVTVTNTATNTTMNNTLLHLGARVGGVAGYNGDIAEVIIYVGNGTAGLLTPAQIAQINAYQLAEYGS